MPQSYPNDGWHGWHGWYGLVARSSGRMARKVGAVARFAGLADLCQVLRHEWLMYAKIHVYILQRKTHV
ncbi:hypothetical protein QUA62_28700 [Microcoleus sp. MON1_C1]|uniref:hypothetical protein n=1 Tax=Microcoleus sp. MON1_C1 TaxID=2818827 RepID=UPI002FD67223